MILSLKEHGYKILFTSRRKIKSIKSYYLGTLLPLDAQKLFLQYYQTQEIEKVDKIIDYLGLHTLFIKLVAETIENEGYSLDDILAKFENGELSKIEFIDEESGDEVTFNHNLQELFSMHNLKDEYISLLKQLSILPSIDIELSFLGEILGNERLRGKLSFLVGRGWLIKNGESYKLHQIIKEFILANYTPTFDELEIIISYFNNFIRGNKDLIQIKNRGNIIIFLQNLDSILNRFDTVHDSISIFFSELGTVYLSLGFYKKAEHSFIKSLNIHHKLFKNESIELGIIYGNLGGCYLSLNEYEKAKKYLLRALRIHQKILGEKHFYTANSYSNLAEFYLLIKSFKKAEKFYLKALEIRNEIFGHNHIDTAISFNNLGAYYLSMKMYQKAKKYLLRALIIHKKISGEEHSGIANLYYNLAILFLELKYTQKAEKFFFKALTIYQKLLIENHPTIAYVYNGLSVLYYRKKNYDKAYKFTKKTIKILSFFVCEEDRELSKAKKNLEKIEKKLNKHKFVSLKVKTKRNDPCPCNSGKKYKKCCGKNI